MPAQASSSIEFIKRQSKAEWPWRQHKSPDGGAMAVELADDDDDPPADRCWEHVPYHPYLRPGLKAAARVSVVPPSAFTLRILGYVGGVLRSWATSRSWPRLRQLTSITWVSVKTQWTPSSWRLINGSHSGEFTLWNGQSFNFEMILQAHYQPIRSMVWSHNENWMVRGDDGGPIKYWQNNMNNVKANKIAPMMQVFKVWDFAKCQEEEPYSGS